MGLAIHEGECPPIEPPPLWLLGAAIALFAACVALQGCTVSVSWKKRHEPKPVAAPVAAPAAPATTSTDWTPVEAPSVCTGQDCDAPEVPK